MSKITVKPVLRSRDRVIPQQHAGAIAPSWIIFNAARPIPGHVTWQGEFLSGVFYAAIDPAGDRAEYYTQRCVALDAKQLLFVSEEQVYEELQAWYDSPVCGILTARAYDLDIAWDAWLSNVFYGGG